MKNGPSKNLQNQSNSLQFVYERLPPARLMLNNDQPLPRKDMQPKTPANTKFILCHFVETKWVPVTQNAVIPTNNKSMLPYEQKLILFSNKRWTIVTFDENDGHEKEKENFTPAKNR